MIIGDLNDNSYVNKIIIVIIITINNTIVLWLNPREKINKQTNINNKK